MDNPTVGIKNAFVHHFRQRWVWEHSVHEFLFRGLKPHGHDETLDQFGDFSSDHMCANEAARLGVEDGLDQALVLAQCNGLAIGEEGELADLEFKACRLGLGFGEANCWPPAGGNRCSRGSVPSSSDGRRGP